MFRIILAGLALATLPLPVAAHSQANETDQQDARVAGGLKLARLVYSAERQSNLAAGSMLDQLADFFRDDPNFQLLEAEKPGAIDAVVDAIRPLMVEFTLKELPRYQFGVARIYARHMTAEELDDAYAFYSSDLGARLIDETQGSLSFDSMLGEIADDPEAQTSMDALRKDQEAAAREVAGNIGDDDIDAMLKIARQGWFRKLQQMRPELLAFDTAYMNEPAPEFEAELAARVEEALNAHMASTDEE